MDPLTPGTDTILLGVYGSHAPRVASFEAWDGETSMRQGQAHSKHSEAIS